MPFLASWFWLLAELAPLVFLERWIHRHLQGVWLLILRDADLALIVYSLVMLPGVILHEGSHWLMATLLLVRTGHFSVVPERMPDGTLRLGYVETAKVDFIREALIGAAPLVFGSAVIMLVGYGRLGMGPVGEALARGDLLTMTQVMQATTRVAARVPADRGARRRAALRRVRFGAEGDARRAARRRRPRARRSLFDHRGPRPLLRAPRLAGRAGDHARDGAEGGLLKLPTSTFKLPITVTPICDLKFESLSLKF